MTEYTSTSKSKQQGYRENSVLLFHAVKNMNISNSKKKFCWGLLKFSEGELIIIIIMRVMARNLARASRHNSVYSSSSELTSYMRV